LGLLLVLLSPYLDSRPSPPPVVPRTSAGAYWRQEQRLLLCHFLTLLEDFVLALLALLVLALLVLVLALLVLALALLLL
tara:strand:- start:128 stop:364 length:237 start_codon:yes stop_codon:yes gene_type:complete